MAIGPMGAREVSREPETVYKAHVEIKGVIHSIYFMFSRRKGVKRVSVMRGDVSDSEWRSYHIETATEINYYVPKGAWIMRVHAGCNPDWLFRGKEGTLRNAIISKAWGRRRCDTVIEDDMIPVLETLAQKNYREMKAEAERKKVVEWCEKQKGVYSLKPKYMEEVKGKMYLQVIDVIFFNRKTKKIDYRENKVAHDTEGAYMLAAQEFGKYDPKIHVKYAHCMFGFNEQNEEEDE